MEVSGFPHQVGGHFGILSVSGHVCKPLSQREYEFYLQMDPRFKQFSAKFCGRIKIQCTNNNNTANNNNNNENAEEAATAPSADLDEESAVSMSTETLVDCHKTSSNFTSSSSSAFSSSLQTSISGGLGAAAEFLPPSAALVDSAECPPALPVVEKAEKVPSVTFRLKSGKVETEKPGGNQWAGHCQSKVVQRLLKGNDKYFIMLEDLVAKYSRPCVMDLKMGTRQHGDDADAQKKLTQTQKCRQSTSSTYGVRLVGMQIYDRQTREFTFVNKYEGRRMDRVQFCDALNKFFRLAGKRRTRRLIDELLKLRRVLSQAFGFRFFSSSLLIAFDAEKYSTNSGSCVGCSHSSSHGITMKMIDFAHSTFNGFLNDKPYTGVDDGYMLGVDSLVSILGMFLQTGYRPARALPPPQTTSSSSAVVEMQQNQNQQQRASLKRKLLLLENLRDAAASGDEEKKNGEMMAVGGELGTENLALFGSAPPVTSDNDNSNWSYDFEDDSSINSSCMGFTTDSGAEMGEPEEEEEEEEEKEGEEEEENGNGKEEGRRARSHYHQQFLLQQEAADKIDDTINVSIPRRLEGFVVSSTSSSLATSSSTPAAGGSSSHPAGARFSRGGVL